MSVSKKLIEQDKGNKVSFTRSENLYIKLVIIWFHLKKYLFDFRFNLEIGWGYIIIILISLFIKWII